jgi:predicted metal-binding membrane protein
MTYAARKQPRPRRILSAFLLAYALVWTGFALAAFVGDSFIHRAVASWPWLAEHWIVIGVGTFTLAGLYQFSPLKERCLTACRSPLGFFVRYYRVGVAGAWRLGLRHGLFCLGCCWTLMLVMFGVGVGGLAWMAGLTGVMVVEKAVPGGKHLTPFIGVALLLLAVLWTVEPAWLGAPGV